MSFLLIIIIGLLVVLHIHKRLEEDTKKESERLYNLGISHKVIRKWYGLTIIKDK